ncbi:creatininase family protein [Micromonospora sp. RL09-050-HVF-A]|uniref:creatininase family protein n=1 Tax=Micromonospora sp. RL09-050-HVF-A TaxID=1703433 RepID=UPI001C5DDD90|nr:creatininase family protein [Micromonospora sp. RL09-050-HVF-A]MBW4702559.1 creatininase family protein [Micromonospora sp. RL09-050-HVF-A]
MTWPTGGGLLPATRIPGGELAAVAAAADYAVLPVGAVEWHGPHLPLGTDLILAEGFAAEAGGTSSPAAGAGGTSSPAAGAGGAVASAAGSASAASSSGDTTTGSPGPRGVLFPAVPYAACPGQTRPWPGTVSIRPEIAVGYLADVIEGIVAAGFPRLLIVNGHDANMSTVRAAMEWVSGRRTASLLLVNWFQLVTPAETTELYGPLTARGHGGAYETSGVLGFDPGAVRLDAVTDLPPKPKLPVGHPYVLVESRPDPWQGWSGHISLASEAAGRQVRATAGARLREIVAAWVAAPPPAPPTADPLPDAAADGPAPTAGPARRPVTLRR